MQPTRIASRPPPPEPGGGARAGTPLDAPAVGGAAEPPREPADAGARRGEALHRKLTWLTFFRLVMVTVLLGGTAAISGDADPAVRDQVRWLYTLIAGTYLVSLAFAWVLRVRRGLVPLAYAQVALDVAIAAAVAALSGGVASPFVFMFSLGIVNGSILLFWRGAVAAALLAVPAYLAVVLGGAEHRPRDWSTIFVHASAFALTGALASYLAEQLRRTGERLEAREGDLATITALHESIVQSVASGLLTLDPRGRVSFLNRAGERMFGLALAAIAGQPAATWFSGFQAQTRRDDAEIVNARGERLQLGYDVFPLRGRDGRELGTAVIFQDLAPVRALEEAVQRSQRLADLGQLAAGLAHELRNPLASMCGSVEILKGSAALADDERRLMEIVLREAARLNDLVTRFLEFTRPEAPRRETVDLSRVLAQTLEVFAHDPAAARVRIHRTLSPAPVTCDPDQMRQVFWNLLANAAHACAVDGRTGVIRVSCAEEGDGAVVSVSDDGVGIDPGHLHRLFTPFFTTKQAGTGLGLATVQRIVDAHGGSVAVDSVTGRGTTFRVRIPSAGPPAALGG